MNSKAERIQAKFNEQVKNGSESQPSTSERKSWTTIDSGRKSKDSSPVKQLKWDKTVLENLVKYILILSLKNERLKLRRLFHV